jgi:hypothetical protein
MHFTHLVDLAAYFKRKQTLRNQLIKTVIYGPSRKKCR